MSISILSAMSLILGVTGMFLSFIYIGSFLCLISLILGVISLKKNDLSYKWPAVCGIACSATGALIVLALSANFYINNRDGHSSEKESQKMSASSNQNKADALEEESSNTAIRAEKNIFSVELTIPVDFVESHTQDEWNKISDEMGYKSITLNPDGSVTYKMTNKQHQEIIESTRQSINTELGKMVGSSEYPNFTDIKTNNNFTEFTVSTTSEELSFAESFSTLAFYVFGGMYNAFSGVLADDIVVTFVNANTGNVLSQANSKDMKNDGSLNNTTLSAKESASDFQPESNHTINMDFNSFSAKYVSHEVSTDFDGDPCVIIYFDFTNNSDEPKSASEIIYLQTFQNGVECDMTFVNENEYIDNASKDVQKGTPIRVGTARNISDMSDLDVIIKEAFSLSGQSDSMKIKLN